MDPSIRVLNIFKRKYVSVYNICLYLYEKFHVGRQEMLPSTEILGVGKPSASLERVQGYHMPNIKIALEIL